MDETEICKPCEVSASVFLRGMLGFSKLMFAGEKATTKVYSHVAA